MTNLKLEPIYNPDILNAALNMLAQGALKYEDNYAYLKVDDNYIHQLFPLLKDDSLIKPDYFSKKGVGAHITVFYPEENIILSNDELGQDYKFNITGLYKTQLGMKEYHILLVESPSLIELRKKYGLPESLTYKGYNICFHLTIAVRYL